MWNEIWNLLVVRYTFIAQGVLYGDENALLRVAPPRSGSDKYYAAMNDTEHPVVSWYNEYRHKA